MVDIRERVLSGGPLVGTFLGLGSPLAAEACAAAGLDWLLVDLEHGAGTEADLPGQLMAAAAHQVPVVVRVETCSRIRIGRVLDMGAAGIMLPRIGSAQDAAERLAYLRYPPAGERGVATYVRACGYGLDPGALARANDEILGVVQIETLAALEEVAGIAALPGADVLFVGPRDLSYALGIPGDTSHPAFARALDRVSEAARAAGVAAGILAPDIATGRTYLDRGFTFIAVGSDSSFVAQSAQAAARGLNAASCR